MTENTKELQSVGDRLLELRTQNHLTQEELAEHLEVSRQSVSKWELNKTLPDVEKLVLLADWYQVSMDYLIRGEMGEEAQNSSDGSDKSTEESIEKVTIENENSGKREKETSVPELYNLYRRTAFLLCAIASCFLCIGSFLFAGQLLFTQAFDRESKEQSLLCVNRIYEQYTKAEVYGTTDGGDFFKETMWLDVPGVREDDYLYCYQDEGKSQKIYFEYYLKTLLLPVAAVIFFLIFFIVFFVEWKKGLENGEKK